MESRAWEAQWVIFSVASPSEAPFVLGGRGAGPACKDVHPWRQSFISPLCTDQTRHHALPVVPQAPVHQSFCSALWGPFWVRPGTQCQASADPGCRALCGESVCHLRFVSTLRLLAEWNLSFLWVLLYGSLALSTMGWKVIMSVSVTRMKLRGEGSPAYALSYPWI